jgi:hypothetical protein
MPGNGSKKISPCPNLGFALPVPSARANANDAHDSPTVTAHGRALVAHGADRSDLRRVGMLKALAAEPHYEGRF